MPSLPFKQTDIKSKSIVPKVISRRRKAYALRHSLQSRYIPNNQIATGFGMNISSCQEDTSSWVLLDVSTAPVFYRPVTISDHTLENQFRKLSDAWYEQKGSSSSVTQKSMLPSYQRIIGLGRPVMPLILRELQHHSDHWFWALEALLAEGEENPVQEVDKGNIRKMTDAWLRWGKDKKLIS